MWRRHGTLPARTAGSHDADAPNTSEHDGVSNDSNYLPSSSGLSGRSTSAKRRAFHRSPKRVMITAGYRRLHMSREATTAPVTIRTAKETVDEIDTLAAAMDRSRNYVINQAIQQYLETNARQTTEERRVGKRGVS